MDLSLFSSGFRQMDTNVQDYNPPGYYLNSPVLKAKSIEDCDIKPIDNFIEPVLRANPTRFTLFPILKPKLFQKYKNHVAVFWTVEEIDLS